MNCTNCSSDQISPSSTMRDLRFDKVISYFRCKNCLVDFQVPIRTDLAHYYESGKYRQYPGNSPENPSASARKITDQRAERQMRFLENICPEIFENIWSVLDVGAYVGSLVGLFRKKGHRAIGYDLDPWAAKASDGRVVSDLDQLEETYDLVCFSHILEHTLSAIIFLKEWMLKIGVKAFIEVPPGNYQYPHTLVFNSSALQITLRMAGFDIEFIDGGMRVVVVRS